MQRSLVVAIDGPSGSGKSSVSRAVARMFAMAYLDTGAMYRAYTWLALHGHSNLSTCRLVVSTDPDRPSVVAEGTDITDAIRGLEVTSAVSEVAARPDVRALAVQEQRRIIAEALNGIVIEGRDITSVVAPDAQVRIFLTADIAAREARRAAEFADPALADRMRATVSARDVLDASREHSPLVQQAGVVAVDATHRTLEETIDVVANLVRAAQRSSS